MQPLRAAAIICCMTSPAPQPVSVKIASEIQDILMNGPSDSFHLRRLDGMIASLAGVDPVSKEVFSGFVQMFQGKKAKAKSCFESAISMTGGDFFSTYNYAVALDYMWDAPGALAMLEKSVPNAYGDPDRCRPVLRRSFLLGGLEVAGKMAEALKQMQVLSDEDFPQQLLNAFVASKIPEVALRAYVDAAYGVMGRMGVKVYMIGQELLPDDEILFSILVRESSPEFLAKCDWEIAKAVAKRPEIKGVDITPFSMVCRAYHGS